MEKKAKSMGQKINLAKIFSLCLKHWLLFGACVAACVMLAGAYIVWRLPKYEVDAQLMIPPETSSGGIMALTDMASSFNLGDMFGTSSTENEVAVMRSHSVFLQTAKDLGLNTACYERNKWGRLVPVYGNAPLAVIADPAVADTISRTVVFRLERLPNGNYDIKAKIKRRTVSQMPNAALPAVVSTPLGDFTIDKTPAMDKSRAKSFKLTFGSYSGAAQAYAKLVKVFNPNKKTDFITMSFVTCDTDFGKLLLNTIIDNYNLLYNEQKNDKSNRSLDFIDNRLASLGEELAASENEMEDFKKKHNLTDVEIDAATAVELNGKLDVLILYQQMEDEILRMTYDFVSAPGNEYALIPNASGMGEQPAGLPGSEISAYNDLVIKRMQVAVNAKPGNAAIKTLDDQIDALRANILSSLEQACKSSDIRLRDLKAQQSQAKGRIGTIPTLEKEYIGLERTLILRQQLYLFLLKQREEAAMNLAKVSPSLLTIDDPYTLAERPGLPNKLVLLLALMIGLCAPLAYIWLVKLKKAPLWSAAEVEDACEAPVAGVLASDGSANGLPVLGKGGGSARQLRANTQYYLDGCQGKSVLVTSPRQGDGKTYAACNLAASMALIGKKTVIVDANIGDPGVAAVFGLDNDKGLAQVAAGQNAQACVQTVQLEGHALDVICAGDPGSADPADLASSAAAAAAIAALKEQYDCVVIDTPALGSQSTAYALAEAADVSLVVLRVRHSSPADAELANDLSDEGRLPRIAIVANNG